MEVEHKPALSNSDHVAFLHQESWGAMCGKGLVPLLVPSVLCDVSEVVPSDDNSSVHLCADNDSLEDTSTDADVSNKWALLVDVGSLHETNISTASSQPKCRKATYLDRCDGRLEAETNISGPADGLALCL